MADSELATGTVAIVTPIEMLQIEKMCVGASCVDATVRCRELLQSGREVLGLIPLPELWIDRYV